MYLGDFFKAVAPQSFSAGCLDDNDLQLLRPIALQWISRICNTQARKFSFCVIAIPKLPRLVPLFAVSL
jgi:hypothetical protein